VKRSQPCAAIRGTSLGQPRASSSATAASPNASQRLANGSSAGSAAHPQVRAASAAMSSISRACCSVVTGSSPAGISSAATSRIRIAAPSPSRPRPPATPTTVWSIRSGSASIRPVRHTSSGTQVVSPKHRIVQSSSMWTCLSTWGCPSIDIRSNATPDFESLCSIGRRTVAPASSSSSEAASGRGVGAMVDVGLFIVISLRLAACTRFAAPRQAQCNRRGAACPHHPHHRGVAMTHTTTDARPAETVDEFVGRFVADLGAVLHGATVLIGDKLGLYKAMAELGPTTPAALADATGTDPRYVQEWLNAQAAADYCTYDPTTGTYHLEEAQRTCLADETHPAFVAGGMAVASSVHRDGDAIVDAFRTGAGVGWHQHHHDLFIGTERFFRPGYVANLASTWIPALDGVEGKLTTGARVADVGCGHGASSILLAQAYPSSTVTGFDSHEPSIDVATTRAADAGVADRVTFHVAAADDLGDGRYDLVCIFDALHDMGDPLAVLHHLRERLAPGGTLMLVEPNAGDRVEDNLNLVGKIYYSASTQICTPASRDQSGAHAACLGAQAGEARLRALAEAAGFTHVRRAAETPFNIVLELRR